MICKQTLPQILDRLESHYGPRSTPTVTDPLQLILWENVGYLIDDQKREVAFHALRDRIGLTPQRILSAPTEVLWEVAELGGILAGQRVGKLRKIARIAVEDFHGNLRSVLKLPLKHAKKALQKFPGIGEPGAEKALLFSYAHPILALESNGLRVLLRLGFGEEKKNYAATYRSVQEAVKPQLTEDCKWLIRAHQLLRHHGQQLCKTNDPHCNECPLQNTCLFYAKSR